MDAAEYMALTMAGNAGGDYNEMDQIIRDVTHGRYSGGDYCIISIGANHTAFNRIDTHRITVVLRGSRGIYHLIPNGWVMRRLLRFYPPTRVIMRVIKDLLRIDRETVITGCFTGGVFAHMFGVEIGVVRIRVRNGSFQCRMLLSQPI
jgi:hypothetical protein